MTDRIRIIKHTTKGLPDTGSFEVQIPGKPSARFYWDDDPGRRLRPDAMTQEQAREAAIELARKEREKMK